MRGDGHAISKMKTEIDFHVIGLKKDIKYVHLSCPDGPVTSIPCILICLQTSDIWRHRVVNR
jgi:hypothetical protein